MRTISRLRLRLSILSGLLCLSAMAIAPAAAQSVLAGPKAIRDVQVLVLPTEVRPGESFVVVVNLAIEDGLHIQAARPLQDYLIGTELKARPADGIAWQDVLFPTPKERTDPTLGKMAEYSGNVRIELPGKVQPDAKAGPRAVSLDLRYQACSDEGTCYPPKTVPIQATVAVAAQAMTPTSPAQSQLPAPAVALPGAAPAGGHPESLRAAMGTRLPWEPFSARRLAELTAAGKTVLIDFTADWCPNCKLNELIALNTQATADRVRQNRVVPLLADFTHEDPEIKAWLVKFKSISVPLTVIIPGHRPTEPILLRDTYRQGTLLTALEKAGASLDLRADARAGLTLQTPILLAESTGSAGWYLLAALLGGFILNFMPCVLPVISIKVLSLLGQSGQSGRRVFGLGLAFSAGMLTLFLALGLLVILAGQTWGALFQSTTFLVVMLGILVAMACSLFGAFTLAVPSVVGDADAAIVGEGYAGSFGKGVLAVLLGTPCSGPLLGSAMAWAAAKSAGGQPMLALMVFLMMGLGMALPFLVLAARPGWMRYLPRPGAWMETFKQAMAFLLLLTAVYILWLLQDRLVAALLYSVGIAFAAWLYGKMVTPLRSSQANWAGRAVVAAVVAAVAWASFASLPVGTSTQAMTATPVQAAGAMDGQRTSVPAQ